MMEAESPATMRMLPEWLAAEPAAEVMEDLARGAVFAKTLMAQPSETLASSSFLAPFQERVMDVAGRFHPVLLTAALPLPEGLHLAVRRLVRLLVDVGALCLGVAKAHAADMTRTQRLGWDSEGTSGLAALNEAWTLAAMARIVAPFDLWRVAHGIFTTTLGAGGEGLKALDHRTDPVILAYKHLLASSVVQAEGLSPREILWVGDFLDDHGALLELTDLEAAATGGFWVDPAQDMAPVAVQRRPPPGVDGLFHLSTEALAQGVGTRLRWLKAGEDRPDDPESTVEMAQQGGLPLGLARRELAALLLRLEAFWSMPPQRELPRRSKHYEVDVCVGLRGIWDLFQYGESRAPCQRCTVFNESPGGFAVVTVGGEVGGGIEAGAALALRIRPEGGWSICLVRWMRSDKPGQVELGLQVVAEKASPIRLGFRSGAWGALVHGLILPPLGANRARQAVLAPAGTYVSRRFVFIREGEQVYVAQGRLLSLDMQTASVELFQFEVDPYPI